MISARPRVTSAAWALGPSPMPSTTPAAMAITFFNAPPISTPTTSSLPYTRRKRPRNSSCTSATVRASAAATTTAVGMPLATSDAKLGPDRTATGHASPTASPSSCDMRSNVPSSSPLVVLTIVAPDGREGRAASITCRRPCDGTATMMSSAPSSALAEIACCGDRRRQFDSRQVDRIFTPPLDFGRQRSVASPQPHVMAGEREMRGERRAEAAGAEDRHSPHDVTRWPIRRSDPSRKRPILDRCRKTISAPTAAAVAVTTGEAPVAHASGPSASVARMEPSEM